LQSRSSASLSSIAQGCKQARSSRDTSDSLRSAQEEAQVVETNRRRGETVSV